MISMSSWEHVAYHKERERDLLAQAKLDSLVKSTKQSRESRVRPILMSVVLRLLYAAGEWSRRRAEQIENKFGGCPDTMPSCR